MTAVFRWDPRTIICDADPNALNQRVAPVVRLIDTDPYRMLCSFDGIKQNVANQLAFPLEISGENLLRRPEPASLPVSRLPLPAALRRPCTARGFRVPEPHRRY